MEKLINKAAVLMEALPYIQKFKDEVFVIKFGGSAMEDEDLITQTMRDIVLLECIGVHPVVVHGGGKAITARLKELNIETRFVNGLRFTCEKTIDVVDDVLHNVINKTLVNAVVEQGGKGQRISGKDVLKAEKTYSIAPDGTKSDVGFVGNIVSVDTQLIMAMAKSDIIPVIAPLGLGEDGQVFNINADTAACEIAEALKAKKLVFLSDVPGILRDTKDEKSIISTIKVSEVDSMIKEGVISGGMIPKIRSCLHAIEAGAEKVHMVDGRVRHSLLLEIFTDSGIGTEIVR
ncbi:MAG: acetylglutamate kinase [Lentisphaerae bacterium GWF2_44_16]|nr:MAG: acetylglutamate kinase [Lentisphaerae bacterium GWF2_44_16]